MIDIIFLDIDGCMTDGKIVYDAKGELLKSFDVKDGWAIESWLKLGKKVAIITGRKSEIVERRAEDLKITHVYQGVGDKLEVAKEILKFEGLSFENAAAIGDDYNDYKILNAVAWSFKPKDAIKDLKVRTKLKHKGGNGAVREMIEMLIEAENLKSERSKRWL
ncbi:HAD hydrolase family protein [Campylobacter sp. RM9344]|uniref:3-deoxy-D-manno-octulosonate 8-phosphate phosphatase KdsC n=1 Tax=Campylobacter californiensis TaxID=1032243 RepID=A0AAW3ZSU2_9BACT|nr:MULTISPECIES: HAD hydrolase family protein [unclassified Campylobacter]MBE2984732.1 HAD hydrolase family protein [Campylobacter sp. RM6883]MBE2994648.1 HAD hydrolase family protein [Campylobacter sp. RM6913]MBE3029174.1 HAD hydrolase family protein [Campylobacter sp. RM9344]MBE3608165.1 HAD hydrolase family protein [Campylobacter sp. RM9337]QCD50456.1 3-deoxy-D-manno-octulosonate 8-phosphate phosphatase, YrbI family [Campylobacter sp. RM6914]